MNRTRFTSLFACLSLVAGLAVGCSGDDTKTTAASATDSSSSGTDSDSASSTSNGSTSTSTSTSAGTESSSTSAATTDTTATTTTTGVTPQPNGSMCSTDAECESMSCFVVPLLGGLCGECKNDDDCPGGCTIPNPLKGVGASCNMGGAGEGCNTDATCVDPANPLCGVVVNAQPLITVQTCGECLTNAECTDPKMPNCNPTVSVADFNGKLTCVEDGSVLNDAACNLADNGMGQPIGNAACMSGKCTTATIMNVVKIGICGECFTDMDCPMGKVCVDAIVDTNNNFELIGAKCM